MLAHLKRRRRRREKVRKTEKDTWQGKKDKKREGKGRGGQGEKKNGEKGGGKKGGNWEKMLTVKFNGSKLSR